MNNLNCQQELVKRRMNMANLDIRAAAVSAGVRLWRVADELGIADASLSRKLRKELPPEEKTKIFSIIQNLSQEVTDE